MLPKVVHHKQNGHTAGPPAKQTGGDVIRAVHSVPSPAPPLTAPLLRFASIVSSERAAALLADVSRRVDGVDMALTTALAKTHAALEHGDLADVRAQLDALRAHVERTARLVNRLIGAAEQDANATRVTLVDVNALLVAALEERRTRADESVAVVARLAPGLPSVAGQPAALLKAVRDALAHVDALDARRAKTFTVETVAVTPALLGEPIVRIRLSSEAGVATGSTQAERVTGLVDAARIVADHGGVMSVAANDGSVLTITIDLPAL